MVLQILVLCLVLAITFLNSMYGLFSGLINMACAIIAMVISLGFFEPAVNMATSMVGWPTPSYLAPMVLVLLYVVSLLVMRLIADMYIRGNIAVPMYVDWIGGGLCGFVIAQISVGILIFGFLMLPFGDRVAMYSRYVRSDDSGPEGRVKFDRVDFWTNSDGFTAGLFSMLSSGSLSGQTEFSSVYPDFAKWVSWTSNTVQEESATVPLRGKDGDGFKDGVRVVTWWEGAKEGIPDSRYRRELATRETPEPAYKKQTYQPEPGNKLLGMRLELDRSARDSDEPSGTHRFRPTMLRIVGTLGDGASARYQDYPARLLRGADPKIQNAWRVADIDNNFAFGEGSTAQVDVYFEVPEDFSPSFVEYRRFARTPIASAQRAEAEPTNPPGTASPAVASGGQGQPQPSASGVLRFADIANTSRSGAYRDLPFTLDAQRVERSPDIQVRGGKIASGRASGSVESWAPERDRPGMREFLIPENQRIIQLTVEARKAGSLAGKVFNFVGATANQYKVLDNAGNEYPLKGYIITTKRGGQDHFEFFYVGDNEELASSFRGMLDPQYITKNELRDSDSTQISLIFLVAPGVLITDLQNQTGQGISGLRYEVPR